MTKATSLIHAGVLASLFLLPCASAFSQSWAYRQQITIDHTKVPNSDKISFPVLVSLTSNSSLSAHARSDGHDIFFMASDGLTVLPYEREYYSGGTLVAWVQVPTLSHTTDTVIYLYYGNPSAADQQQATHVWDSNFKGVWHLKETPPATLADSTTSGDYGSPSASSAPTQTSGQIDGALSFNGSAAVYMAGCSYPGGSPAQVQNNWTLEAWMNPANLSQLGIAVMNGNESGGFGFGVGDGSGNAGSKLQGIYGGQAWVNSQYIFPSANTWYHVVMVNASGTTSFYVNGTVQAGTTSTTPNTPANEFTIGCEYCSLSRPFNGSVDEVRISNTGRSADWIKTEYNNQSSPGVGAFLKSVGAEQTAPSRISLVQAVGADSGAASSATASLASTTAGNLLVVAVWYQSLSAINPTITDNSSGGANTYTSVGEFGTDPTYNVGSQIYYAKNIKGGNTTVTVSDTSSLDVAFTVYEIAGADPSSPLDGHGHVTYGGVLNNGTWSASSVVSASITASAGDMVIATGTGDRK